MSDFRGRYIRIPATTHCYIKSTGQAIGECKLHWPDREGIAATDVKLLPEFWGNKYGVEVKRGLLDYLFTHTECLAVDASPNVGNLASIKMQEAVGGVCVGESIYEFPESNASILLLSTITFIE